MIVKLVEHGHLAVVWGRKGRGHPNRYSMIVKPQQAAVSKPQQAAVLASPTKPQPDEFKPQPDDHKTAAGRHELLRNHLNNEAASPPSLVTTVVMEDQEDQRERAFGALLEAYPNKTNGDHRNAFDELLDQGIEADDLIAAAKHFAKTTRGTKPKDHPLLCFWLRVLAKPALEAPCFSMGRAAKSGRATGDGLTIGNMLDDITIAPKAGAGKIYQSHYEAAYEGYEL